VVQNLDYLPFGELNSTDSGISTHKFTGDERDAESNLDHTQFRQYSSSLGRWMHPDPAGLVAVDPTNPQSWNRYAYVLNNPMTLVDPSGLCPPTVQNHDTGDWPSGSWGGGPSMLGEAADPEPQAQPCQSAPWYYGGGGGGGGVSLDGGYNGDDSGFGVGSQLGYGGGIGGAFDLMHIPVVTQVQGWIPWTPDSGVTPPQGPGVGNPLYYWGTTTVQIGTGLDLGIIGGNSSGYDWGVFWHGA